MFVEEKKKGDTFCLYVQVLGGLYGRLEWRRVQQKGAILASDDHLQDADVGEDLLTSPEAKAETHGEWTGQSDLSECKLTFCSSSLFAFVSGHLV